MSDKQLWSDSRIRRVIPRFVDPADVAIAVRDDYEAALAAKDARIQEIEAELALYTDGAEMHEDARGDDWATTVDYLLAHAPEPEPPLPEPPDDWDEGDDEDKPHYDTPGGF
jgi:hypothetical protein